MKNMLENFSVDDIISSGNRLLAILGLHFTV